ncbi:hypothetical protein ABT297_04120 [Dactylosporangium sp. NPDC000555]|uniref:hypothetical protein n=1 Tax=Dactylosporangium sp. NPDC000555 TaxID=3154260 RepID=UPI00331E6B1B
MSRDLAHHEAGPQPRRDDFGPLEAYNHAWYIWRAIWRDAHLTNDELDAQFRVLAERLGHLGTGLWDDGSDLSSNRHQKRHHATPLRS